MLIGMPGKGLHYSGIRVLICICVFPFYHRYNENGWSYFQLLQVLQELCFIATSILGTAIVELASCRFKIYDKFFMQIFIMITILCSISKTNRTIISNLQYSYSILNSDEYNTLFICKGTFFYLRSAI